MSVFSENLKRFRQQKGLNQADVAEQISTSLTQIRRWESGQTSPSIDNAALLARCYGVSLDELYPSEKSLKGSKSDSLDVSELKPKQLKVVKELVRCFCEA